MKKKFISILLIGTLYITSFCGCNLLDYEISKTEEMFKGKNTVIQTYDEESNIIDKIEGKSIFISSDDKFATKDKDGNTIKNSSVISISIGKQSMTHVGSSLISYEDGLINVYDEFTKKVNINNLERSVPVLNKMIYDMKNITTGKSKVILIRSQSGKPLATFVGNNVSYFATKIDKSIGILIDGKYLFIYRCDYSIYDMDLLQ